MSPSKGAGTVVNGTQIYLHGSTRGITYSLSQTYLVSTEYSILRFKMDTLQQLVGVCLSGDFTASGEDKLCFEFSTPAMMGLSWQMAELPIAKRYNLALGKQCQTSVARDSENSCSAAIDGSLSTKYKTTSEDEEKLFEVHLGEEKLIRTIIIHKDISTYNMTLFVTNDDRKAVYQANIIGSLEKVSITLPYIYGSNIQIRSYSKEQMSLRNIEVFEDTDPTKARDISLPLGLFFRDRKIKYLTFIQYDEDKTVTQVSNINFENGKLL